MTKLAEALCSHIYTQQGQLCLRLVSTAQHSTVPVPQVPYANLPWALPYIVQFLHMTAAGCAYSMTAVSQGCIFDYPLPEIHCQAPYAICSTPDSTQLARIDEDAASRLRQFARVMLIAGSYADRPGSRLHSPRQALFMSSFNTAEHNSLPPDLPPPWRGSIHRPTFNSPAHSHGLRDADPCSPPAHATALSAAHFGW